MIIEKNIDEVYRIIKNLRPTVLDDLGFEAQSVSIDNHLESRESTATRQSPAPSAKSPSSPIRNRAFQITGGYQQHSPAFTAENVVLMEVKTEPCHRHRR
jgi:hypothetical protein